MDRSAIDYLNYLEDSDPYFYHNFKEFIVYASGLNKGLKDEEYDDLKNSKESDYNVTLRDKRTTVNIVKNFFYKISPNIIRQIDFDMQNNNIVFLPKEQMGKVLSRITLKDGNYKIEVVDSSKIEESYLLVREYARLFSGNILDATEIDKGLRKVYLEVIISLTEFALAKHLATNKSLMNDSRNYINKKLYDSIYNMNDSYMTLIYLGYLLEGKTNEEIVRLLGKQEIVDKLSYIIKNKKPCNDYIYTLGTMFALRIANNCDNIYDVVNIFYIKASSMHYQYFLSNISLELNQNESVEEITYYIRNNK